MPKSKFRSRPKAKAKGKKKEQKLKLTFDPNARKEFLTGFRKRKLEKKENYKKKMEVKLAAEKQRIRAQARNSLKKTSASNSIVPEVEALLSGTVEMPSDSFDLGSKTVTIQALDPATSVFVPNVKDSDEDMEDEDVIQQDAEDGLSGVSSMKASSFKKATYSLLQKSQVYKMSQRIKQQSSRNRNRGNPSNKSGKAKKTPDKRSKFRGGKNHSRFSRKEDD